LPGAMRQEVLSLVAVFRAKVVDISQTRMIIEATGNKEKVEAFIGLLRPLGIHDITRTGCIAIGRLTGTVKTSTDDEEEDDTIYAGTPHETTLVEGTPERHEKDFSV